MGDLVYLYNDRPITDSRTVADVFHKNHKDVLRDIRQIIKRDSNLNKYFKKSIYINSRNRIYKKYIITKKGYDILINKYKLHAIVPSLEKPFGEWLRIFFPHEKIIPQYHILQYYIDWYFVDLGI